MAAKEKERKFLIIEASLPENLLDYPEIQIMQGYLSYDPEERIRAAKEKGETKYYLTKKGEGTIERDEDEKEISGEDFFDKIKRVDRDAIIRKTRYKIPLTEGLTAELDFYHNPEFKNYAGPNTGELKTVEIEFQRLDDAKSFKKPEWFGEEVTEDKAFKNKNLSKVLQQKQR